MEGKMLNAPMTVEGKIVSSQVIDAGIGAMRGDFTNMDVAAAMGRAGFEPNDLWIRQEVANRLMQRARKQGYAVYTRRTWRVLEAA
jgi:hypothetical protein